MYAVNWASTSGVGWSDAMSFKQRRYGRAICASRIISVLHQLNRRMVHHPAGALAAGDDDMDLPDPWQVLVYGSQRVAQLTTVTDPIGGVDARIRARASHSIFAA